jgi:hypothetical protein
MNFRTIVSFQVALAYKKLSKLLLIICLLPNLTLAQQPLRYDVVGKTNWAPYFTQNEEHPGIIVEIIERALSEAGIPLEPVQPGKYTTPNAIEQDEVDIDIISPSWFKDNKIPEEFIISARIIPIAEYIVYRPDDEYKWPNKEALYDRHVGVVRDYRYHDEQKYVRDEYDSEHDLLLALKHKKTNVAIVGELPLYYWSHSLDLDVKRGPLHSRGYLHIRIGKDNVYYLKLINKAIASMKQSGEIDRIFESYHSVSLAP